MKKYIIIISSILILTVAGLFIWNYLSSFRDVIFSINEPGLSVDIYNKDETKIASLSDTKTTLTLRDGGYYYQVNSDKMDKNRQNFSVNKSVLEVIINPDYSSNYLADLLSSQKDEIIKIIKDTYPSIINNYNITNGQLFSKGEWFGAIIERKTPTGDISDPYKVIMNKQDGKWLIIHYPEIVATKYNFPEVPINILDKINNL